MRRTKIVCTVGPATRSPEMLAARLEAGMDVARLNFSHGVPEDHAQAIDLLRDLAAGAPLWVRGTTNLIRLHRVERQG
jgi:pyruvate kinase